MSTSNKPSARCPSAAPSQSWSATAKASIGSGLLGEKMEAKLRQSIAETLAAFNMPSMTERSDAQA
jgi:hypothetical protein